MAYIKGESRDQIILMPDCLEDYVTADNPVRVIDAFVDQLDVAAQGFKAEPAVEGRPGYDPRDMLKLYIYGYNNKNPFITQAANRSKTKFRIDVAA